MLDNSPVEAVRRSKRLCISRSSTNKHRPLCDRLEKAPKFDDALARRAAHRHHGVQGSSTSKTTPTSVAGLSQPCRALIDIRRRIRSVKNTQQITKAMKMVSAAKLRRAQDRIFAARPYAAALREVLSSVATARRRLASTRCSPRTKRAQRAGRGHHGRPRPLRRLQRQRHPRRA